MSETIGQKLRGSREAKRLSLQQVSVATRIRLHYLEALERDDLSAIPSTAQARGFLRIYVDYLDLNLDEFVPVVRPSEPQSIVSSPDAETLLGTGLPAAPVQATISTPAPARSNLLSSLRERFIRPSNTENGLDASHEAEQSAVPEPKFVPARYIEELPSEPAPVVIEEPATQEEPKPAKRLSSRKTTFAKKPALRNARTSSKAKAGNKSEVKKKITRMSRPKRGSSSRKLSSSPTHHVSKKMSSCMLKKHA